MEYLVQEVLDLLSEKGLELSDAVAVIDMCYAHLHACKEMESLLSGLTQG